MSCCNVKTKPGHIVNKKISLKESYITEIIHYVYTAAVHGIQRLDYNPSSIQRIHIRLSLKFRLSVSKYPAESLVSSALTLLSPVPVQCNFQPLQCHHKQHHALCVRRNALSLTRVAPPPLCKQGLSNILGLKKKKINTPQHLKS